MIGAWPRWRGIGVSTMNQRMNADHGVLVLVDFQQRLMPMIDGGDRVLAQALRLGAVAHELGVPVLGTEQNPRGLGRNDDAVRALCTATLEKMHFDACEAGLATLVRDARTPAPTEVVIAGCEAHVCLLQTALGLLRAGLRVHVVADASGSRLASNHVLAMQRLRDAGALIVSYEMVAFEWLHGCEHPRFKAVLQHLKLP